MVHYGDGSFAFGPPLRASKYDYHLVLEKFDLRVAGVVRDAETGAPLSGFEAAARMTSGERAIHAGVWYESARFDNADGSFLVGVYSPWRSEREDAVAI